jgi:hypothetical protein
MKSLKIKLKKDFIGRARELECLRKSQDFHYLVAKILGFSGIKYKASTFYIQATEQQATKYQIDLLFDRADNVYTICEMKYLNGKVGTSVIDEFEKKLSLFPNKADKTIHKVLICNNGADKALENRAYFDVIITCEQLLDARNW